MAKGRPTKFTKEVGEKIISEIKDGFTQKVACAKAGISPRTLQRWKNKADGQKTKTDLKCFFEELEIAEGIRQGLYEDVTRESALINRNPCTAKWYLSHLDKDTFGQQEPEQTDTQEIEITDDEVEWINHVSDYNTGTNANTSK